MGMVWCQPAVCRDAQIESLTREVDTLRAEMEKIKLEVRPWYYAVGLYGGNPNGMQWDWGMQAWCTILGPFLLPAPSF